MPGSVIIIPLRQASDVYVTGKVTRPGPFEFPADKGIKLLRALAMAGGPTRTSKLQDTAVLRQKADGSVDRIALDLSKVLQGKAPDLPLQPNDLLFVPSSITRNIGWATMATLPSTILSRLLFY